MVHQSSVVAERPETLAFPAPQPSHAPHFVISNLGGLEVTHLVMAKVSLDQVMHFINRHRLGDWGNIDQCDRTENQEAIEKGRGRILSRYPIDNYKDLYVVTYWDRSKTLLTFLTEGELDCTL